MQWTCTQGNSTQRLKLFRVLPFPPAPQKITVPICRCCVQACIWHLRDTACALRLLNVNSQEAAITQILSMQALAPIALALLAVAVAAWLMTRRKRYTPVPGTKPIPEPPRHPLLGHIPLLAKVVKAGHHTDVLAQQLSKEYGPMFVLDVLFFKLLILSDPDVIKEVRGSDTGHPAVATRAGS